jgi:hypothetical protein
MYFFNIQRRMPSTRYVVREKEDRSEKQDQVTRDEVMIKKWTDTQEDEEKSPVV